ncbi:GNAT family N-acetyltransferase [Paenibacillus sp. HB172176]|uniref:GNAT family N-acetyltransferase n=1 Tax=Paenibacillus sp. HB172176 TaxID=2493690 RepID=UPI0014387B5B|nr:GNAT family N-acetyltransferase [Paenibacillus sp. HB172176]
MFIRILTETDAEAYQAIRLTALTINPEAFGSTYEREAAFSIADVRQRIKPSAKQCVLGAFDMSETLIGIVTLLRESGKKTSHKANVYGLFVSENQREIGVGRALMEALLHEARRMDGVEQLNLSVAASNAGAIKLYQAMGFRSYGLEYRSLKANGDYADEYLMTYWLLESDANIYWNQAHSRPNI